MSDDRYSRLVERTRVVAYVRQETTAPIVAALILSGADLDVAEGYAAWLQRRMVDDWTAGRVMPS